MQKLWSRLACKLDYSVILTLYLILSPTIDLVTSLMVLNFASSVTLGLVIKGLFMAFTLFYLFSADAFHPRYKKITLWYFALCFAFMGIFLLYAASYKSMAIVIAEGKALVKYFYYPLLSVALFNILYKERRRFDKKALIVNILYYIFVIVLSRVSLTYYASYSSGKLGHAGWYAAANEVSAAMGILTPLLIGFLLKIGGNLKIVLRLGLRFAVFVLVLFALCQIGTKVAFLVIVLSLLAAIFAYGMRMIFARSLKGGGNLTGLCFCVFLLVFSFFYLPYSPVGQNLRIHAFWVEGNYTNLSEQYQQDLGELQEDAVDTSEMSEETLKILSIIFSSRDRYFLKRYVLYTQAPSAQQLLGMGSVYEDGTKGFVDKTVEIDLCDVFFNYGIVGFILYFAFTGALFFGCIRRFFAHLRHSVASMERMMDFAGVLLAFGISVFAGHVFTAPAVSLYAALLLPVSYYGLGKEDLLLQKKPLYRLPRRAIAGVFVLLGLLFALIYPFRKDANAPEPFADVFAVLADDIVLDTYGNEQTVLLSKTQFVSKITYALQETGAVYFNTTRRTLPNGDEIYFFTVSNPRDEVCALSVELKADEKVSLTQLVHADGAYEADGVMHPGAFYVQNEDSSSIFASAGYVYTSVRESESEQSRLSDVRSFCGWGEFGRLPSGAFGWDIVLPGNASYSAFFIVSEEPLLTLQDQEAIDEFAALAKAGDLPLLQSEKGNYAKASSFMRPLAKHALAVSAQGFCALSVRDEYDRVSWRLYADLMVNDAYSFASVLDTNKLLAPSHAYRFSEQMQAGWGAGDVAESCAVTLRLYHNLSGLEEDVLKKVSENCGAYLLQRYTNGDMVLCGEEQNRLFASFSTEDIVSLSDNLSFLELLLTQREQFSQKDYDEMINTLCISVSKSFKNWRKDEKHFYKYFCDGKYYLEIDEESINLTLLRIQTLIEKDMSLTNEAREGIMNL